MRVTYYVTVITPTELPITAVRVKLTQLRAGKVYDVDELPLPASRLLVYTKGGIIAGDTVKWEAVAEAYESTSWSHTYTEAEARLEEMIQALVLELKRVAPPPPLISLEDLKGMLDKETAERKSADDAIRTTVEARLAQMQTLTDIAIEARATKLMQDVQTYLAEGKLPPRIDEGLQAAAWAKEQAGKLWDTVATITDQLKTLPDTIAGGAWAVVEEFVGMILSGIMSGLEEGFKSIEADSTELENTTKVKVG
jgi:hypothetical protein